MEQTSTRPKRRFGKKVRKGVSKAFSRSKSLSAGNRRYSENVVKDESVDGSVGSLREESVDGSPIEWSDTIVEDNEKKRIAALNANVYKNASNLVEESETKSRSFYSWLRWSPDLDSTVRSQLRKHFPGAMPDLAVLPRLKLILEDEQFGILPGNTIFGSSVCPDEINNEKGGLIDMLKSHFGQCMPIGGLSGAPLTGKTGFGAFAHHVPDNGNVFVLFAPHIAITDDGEIGKILREGQSHLTTSCGAVCGAYEACRGREVGDDEEFDPADFQMHWIQEQLKPYVEDIAQQEEPMASLVFQAFEMVKKQIKEVVHTGFTETGRLVLLGGIQINMPGDYHDHFLPLMLELRQKDVSTGTDIAVDCLDKFRQTLQLRESMVEYTKDPFNMGYYDADFSRLGWGPKLDTPCRNALRSNFHHAMPGKALLARVCHFLHTEYGLKEHNTHFATSLCPDEINNKIGGLQDLMKDCYGQLFCLGGISGAPLTGKTGYNAFAHHVPDNGNIVLLFGPHVGITSTGEVGSTLRSGQSNHSTACGATIGAYNALCHCTSIDDEFDQNDFQMDWIKSRIAPHMTQISESENPMSALAYQAFDMVQGKLDEVINMELCSGNVVLIGGIQINLPDGMDDYFQPMMFEVRKNGEETKSHMDVLQRDKYIDPHGAYNEWCVKQNRSNHTQGVSTSMKKVPSHSSLAQSGVI